VKWKFSEVERIVALIADQGRQVLCMFHLTCDSWICRGVALGTSLLLPGPVDIATYRVWATEKLQILFYRYLSLINIAHCVHRPHRTSQYRRFFKHTTLFTSPYEIVEKPLCPAMTYLTNGHKVTPPYQRPNLYIHGIGVEYPPHLIRSEDLATLARRFYPKSAA
jgi:hypothetical protein